MSPSSRYGGSALKVGPCGLEGGQRSNNVTELESGATVEVVWNEYIDHPGHFRIAFDENGDDDFTDPPCLGGCGSRSPDIELYSDGTVLLDGIADTHGGVSRVMVTLPDIECDDCTLQVVQVMYDKPPYVIPGNDLYYQCADLVLRRSASPTPTPAFCVGDCGDDGKVEISELVTMVRIALDLEDIADCPLGDADGDGAIRVGELIAAVTRSLTGC